MALSMVTLVSDDGVAVLSVSKGIWGDSSEPIYLLHFGVEVAEDSLGAHPWVERLPLSPVEFLALETFFLETQEYFKTRGQRIPSFPLLLAGRFSGHLKIYGSEEEDGLCVTLPAPQFDELMVAPVDTACGYIPACTLLVRDVLEAMRGAM